MDTIKTLQSVLSREQYQLTFDAYTGSGSFASGEALFKFGREYSFTDRKAMVSYNNLLQQIINAKVDPVFAGSSIREYKTNAIIDEFLLNADNNGTSLTDMVNATVTNTVLVGQDFLIVDNFPEDMIPKTLNDVLEERKFPYIYSKSVLDVYGYETDDFGKLVSITFYYGKYGDTDDILYKRFNRDYTDYFVINKSNNMATERILFTNTHNLGCIPVAYNNNDILPFPKYYSMATMARQLLNLDSSINDLGRAQMFSILLIPSTRTGNSSEDAIVISTSNALFFDSQATHKPEYISPDSSIMGAQLEQRKTYYDAFLQNADLMGTSASVAKSGISYAYEFFGKMYELIRSSDIANTIDSKVIDIVSRYLGIDIDYTVQYPDKFSPTFTETQQQSDYLIKIADLEMSDTVVAQCNSELIRLTGEAFGWDKEVIDNLVDSIVGVSQVV